MRVPERRIKSHLNLTVSEAPIDPLLFYAIPGTGGSDDDEATAPDEPRQLSDGARFLAGLMLDGTVEANGPIEFFEDRQHTGFEIDLTLESASSMSPEAARAQQAALGTLDWQWPGEYPIHNVTAQAHLSKDRLLVHSLTGRHDSEELAAKATVDWSVNDQPAVIDVQVNGTNMTFAPYLCDLLGSLAKQKQRDTLTRFWDQYDPRGAFDLILEYTAGGGRASASHRMDIAPKAISVMMDGTRVGLTDAGGHLVLGDETIRFANLSGQLECSGSPLGRLQLLGTYAWAGGQAATMSGELTEANLNEEFLGLATGRLADDTVSDQGESPDAPGNGLVSWAPRLSGNATFNLHFDEAGLLHEYVINATPTRADFTWASQRYELTSLLGNISLTPGRIDLNSVSGNFQDGSFTLNGWTRFVGDRLQSADLTYSGSATHLSNRVRMLIPDSPRQAVDAIDLRSDKPVRIEDATLTYSRPLVSDDEAGTSTPHLGPASFDFTTNMSVESAALDISVPVTELRANINVEASRASTPTSAAPVDYLITVDAQRMRVKDRAATNGMAQIESAPDGTALLLSRFSADCYGGHITAQGRIDMPDSDRTGGYHFDLVMDGVGIGPLINPPGLLAPDGEPAPPAQTGPDRAADEGNSSGTTRASLSVAGELGNRDSRRGRGMARVYNAKLYNVPVIMAVLQLSSLSLPIASAFDFVDLSFCLQGDSVQIEDLSLHSSNVVLNGAGTVDINSGALDLWLNTTARLRTPLLTDIWESLRDALLGIHVTGTLDEPVRSIVPFAHNDQGRRRVIGTQPSAASGEAEAAESQESRQGG
ncbi:MAG: hypothetical protein HND57_05040 [Planctomycetes bacterium]|nr:hypothetical protein [Planctomycetota bacterium]